MARYVVKLPDIGEGMTEAEIVAWHVKPGQAIREEDPLVEIMTDKATVELPAPVGGTVVAINGQPGEKRPVGSDLVVLDVAGAGNVAEAEPLTPALSPLAGRGNYGARPSHLSPFARWRGEDWGDGLCLRRLALARHVEHHEVGADRPLLAGLAVDRDDSAGDRRGQFDRRLVGHDLDERIFFPDYLARLDVPGDDLGLGHALADIRQLDDVAGHRSGALAL